MYRLIIYGLLILTSCAKSIPHTHEIHEGGVVNDRVIADNIYTETLEGGVLGDQVVHSGGVYDFHHTEVSVTHQTDLAYPTKAIGLGLGPQTCDVYVLIGSDGVPYDVKNAKCVQIFMATAQSSVLKWRWDPPLSPSGPVNARVLVRLQFTP